MRKIVITLIMSLGLYAGTIGTDVVLSGSDGGYVRDAKAWEFKKNDGKVRLILYVDPDEQSKGEVFKETTFKLEQKYPSENFVIQVIINLDATWIPNVAIENKLATKQKNIPQREFIIDKNKVLVDKWGLKDNEYNILLFDKDNKLRFNFSGEFKEDSIEKLLKELDLLMISSKK